MSERLDAVAGALDRSLRVAEYVVTERRVRAARTRVGVGVDSAVADRRALRAVIYRDLRRGRGSASFRVGDHGGDIAALIDAAARRAGLAIGPAWRLPPPSAPARVDVADPALGDRVDVAAELVRDELRGLVAPGGPIVRGADSGLRLARAEVSCARAETEVRTNRGLTARYVATAYAVDLAIVGAPGQVEVVRARARRRVDLDLAGRVAAAAERLRDRARAARLAPGEYDLALAPRAWVPPPGVASAAASGAGTAADASGLGGGGVAGYGWLAPVVVQADAGLARRGLTRYQPGHPVYDPRTATGDPVTVISDGTLPYGLLSQPFGDHGEPVRRFALIEAGVAADLALDLREAALRGVPANAGVRNLVVAPGPTAADVLIEPGDRPVVEVADLSWLMIDPRTGAFSAELGLGYLRPTGDARGVPVVGGTWRGDVWDLLSRARLSAEVIGREWYRGPSLVRVDRVRIE